MRFTILLVLLACVALTVASASKESGHHPSNRHPPRKSVGQAVEAPTKRVKRHAALYRRPVLYYDYYGRPYYIYV